jgi:hypothetical protein
MNKILNASQVATAACIRELEKLVKQGLSRQKIWCGWRLAKETPMISPKTKRSPAPDAMKVDERDTV